MSSIKILDPHTANQIAAGEVIENPASAVKELVENSIDAEATNIKIEIKDGGTTFIRVSDDGIGISSGEVKTAFKRHATSKITSFKDLENIRTLGFRGEALASITAVSRTEVFTRTKDKISGVYLQLEGGKVKYEEEKGGPTGTVITVKDLFFNVPARKKHLKGSITEAAAVGSTVNKLALSNPKVKITYVNNGSLVFVSPGNNNLFDTISALFGNSIASKMIEIISQEDNYSVSGYVSLPELTRGNRTGQYFIVNGRHIINKLLSEALEEAYHTLLPKHRFPFAVINIQVNPSLVDVNVHPAKREIRWAEPQKIRKIITKTVARSLSFLNSIPGFTEDSAHNKKENNDNLKGNSLTYNQESFKWQSVLPLVAEMPEKEEKSFYNKREERQLNHHKKEKMHVSKSTAENNPQNSSQSFLSHASNTIETVKPEIEEKQTNDFPNLIALGQIDATYILAKCEEKKGFFIIDQHAAHERIIYDTLLKKLEKAEIVSQYLATPIPLELSPAEMSSIIKYIVYIKKLGFCLEHFGDNTYLIRAIPHGLNKLNPEEFIYDLISTEINNVDKSQIYHTILQVISCKGAIKAGEKMHPEAIQKLLLDLKETKIAYTCPHGRPTIIYISEKELLKRFYR
jgi:DNA mismatch repair protein MutL